MDGGDCRTAPATTGLLNINIFVPSSEFNIVCKWFDRIRFV